MSRKKSVTVVIPTHNRLDFLKAAVESVLGLRRLEEVVVVVDRSTDGSAEWLAGHSDRRVKSILLTQHSERAATRNAGLTAASMEYVLFLDDDDELGPGCLEPMADALDRHSSAVAAVGATRLVNDRGNRVRLHHPRRTRVHDILPDVMIGWSRSPGCTLFRTDVVRGVGGWPPEFVPLEDQHLWLEVSRLGPAVLVPVTTLFHLRHSGQTRPEMDARFPKERELRRYFIDHSPESEREYLERLFRARELFIEATFDWHRNDQRKALHNVRAAIREFPSMTSSPLMGRRVRSMLMRSTAASVMGPEFARTAQKFVWTLRRATKRAPENPAGILPPVKDSPD